MKNINWHYFYIPAIALLVLLSFMLGGSLDDSQRENKSLISANEEKDAKVEKLTNALGEEIYRKQAAELRTKDLEKAYPELAKTLEKQFDVKMKNLQAYIENQFVTRSTGTGNIVNNHYYDSTTNTSLDSLKYHATDGYMDFKVNFELKFNNSKLTYTQSPYVFQYADTAKTVVASNKKPFQFWKNEKLYATTKFSNPNTSLIGATNILVDNYRDKRWSIGFSAGWGIVKVQNDIKTGWFIGPSIEYALFKF